jgi:hypothetical protein
MKRRTFLDIISKAVGYLAIPGKEYIADMGSALQATIDANRGKDIGVACDAAMEVFDALNKGSYDHEIKILDDVEAALAAIKNAPVGPVQAAAIRTFNFAKEKLLAGRDSDIVACFEQYLVHDKPLAKVMQDPVVRNAVRDFVKLKEEMCKANGIEIKYSANKVTGIIGRPSAERAQNFDRLLGFSERAPRVHRIAEVLKEVQPVKEKEDALIRQVAANCTITQKITSHKGFGYNITYNRPQIRKSGFKLDATHSEWERQATKLALAINTHLKDGKIVNETHHQGRMVLITEKDSYADKLIQSVLAEQSKAMTAPIRLGGR